MQNFVTVEEKSAEWGVTTRHIQKLCRNGKIRGATKRVGAWFIPADTPSPAKNTKADSHPFNFVGTKKRIFENAIELFMLNGFETVKILDIAEHSGIRQSTVYNHFKSKQEILDTIYAYYCHYYLADRPTFEALKPIIQNGSLADLFRSVQYTHNDDYSQKLSDISKIIFQRITIDDKAREIAKSLTIEENINYVETVFNLAIKAGRIPPCDTHIIAVFINSVKLFLFYNMIINPSHENISRLGDDTFTLYTHAASIFENLKSFA